MNRKEAIEKGFKTYIGKPCKCGCEEKYVSSYGCIKCTLARNSTEYIKQYSKTEKAIARSKNYINKIKADGKITQYNEKWRNGTGKGKAKEYYNNNKDIHRNCSLKRTYGITLEQYNEMLVKQEFKCAICNKHASTFKKNLAVDHDHDTGKVRSLLCSNCNSGLGKFKDSVELMNKAIEYIMRYKC